MSTALPTKGEIHFLRSTHRVAVGLKRRKSVKVSYHLVHKSSLTLNGAVWSCHSSQQGSSSRPVSERSGVVIDHSRSRGPQASTRSPPNITRQPPNFRFSSGALTESEPNRRLNQNTFVYGSSTAVPPLYPTSIRAPSQSPIPGTTFTVPVGGVVPPEPGDTTQTISPVTSTRPALPPISIRPLPLIPKPFAVPPPVTSGHVSFGVHPAYSPVHQRRRVPRVSLDEIDYREVITAFLENDDSVFHDAMSGKAIPPFYCNWPLRCGLKVTLCARRDDSG